MDTCFTFRRAKATLRLVFWRSNIPRQRCNTKKKLQSSNTNTESVFELEDVRHYRRLLTIKCSVALVFVCFLCFFFFFSHVSFMALKMTVSVDHFDPRSHISAAMGWIFETFVAPAVGRDLASCHWWQRDFYCFHILFTLKQQNYVCAGLQWTTCKDLCHGNYLQLASSSVSFNLKYFSL